MGVDKTSCGVYPSGIFGCLNYRTKVSCEKCQPLFYLKNEICYPVAVEITNCVNYDDEGICTACLDGYIIF